MHYYQTRILFSDEIRKAGDEMVDIVDTRLIRQRAKAIYAGILRESLERDHLHEFVAIEPDSGEYFIGKTLGAAIEAAQVVYPDRLTHTIRIGHDAALEIGYLPACD